MSNMKSLRVALPLACVAAVSACASNPELDPREVQRAQIAIEEAKEVNAGRHAADALARAEERLSMAHEAVEAGEEEQARRLIDESVVLAELAEARALERDSQQALDEIRTNLQVLEERLQ